jgi:hypothetical protein
MSYQLIPLTTSPNQTFQSTLAVDSKNITLEFNLKYNEIAEYWIMKITDPSSNTLLLDSVPLIPGNAPAGNILEQYEYLGIGSAFIVKSSNVAADYPSDTTLGTDFLLVWGDTL